MFPLDPSLEGKRLYLMRHGKTYEPHLDTKMVLPEEDPALPLTPDGRDGVRATAAALATHALDAAFASTFARSLETARIVAEPHALEVQPRPGLEELRIYPPEGGDLRGTARRYIELARRLEREAPHDVELESGGTLGELLDRALAALSGCLQGPARRVVVVAHGGLNRLMLSALLDVPLARFLTLDQDFGCVNVIEFVRRGRPWVRVVNATVHDPFKAGPIRV